MLFIPRNMVIYLWSGLRYNRSRFGTDFWRKLVLCFCFYPVIWNFIEPNVYYDEVQNDELRRYGKTTVGNFRLGKVFANGSICDDGGALLELMYIYMRV